jgi:phosphoglycerate dehydrogenase-like enzyme
MIYTHDIIIAKGNNNLNNSTSRLLKINNLLSLLMIPYYLNFKLMENTNKSPSRRNFLKGVAFNAAALSALPVGVLASDLVSPDPIKKDKAPRLPLKLMMTSGLPDPFQEKLMNISPEIQLIENEGAIGEVNAWYGSINSEQFKKAPNLDWVHSTSAGVERYLFPEMLQSDVVLTNAKGCYGPAIAEHTFGLLFSLTRKIGSQTRNMSQGKWEREDNMFELKGMTVGIVGLGGIGSQVARRARAMDMGVIAVDILPKYREQIGDICDEIRLVQDDGLSWLLSNSDVIVISAPHTKVSEGMMGAEQFGMMKKSAYFINVARGKIVKTPALVEALKSGQIAGAGLDVTDPEPLPSDHELWGFPNVIITSHIAARSQYNRERLYSVFVENVHRYVNGFPMMNLVDKELGF